MLNFVCIRSSWVLLDSLRPFSIKSIKVQLLWSNVSEYNLLCLKLFLFFNFIGPLSLFWPETVQKTVQGVLDPFLKTWWIFFHRCIAPYRCHLHTKFYCSQAASFCARLAERCFVRQKLDRFQYQHILRASYSNKEITPTWSNHFLFMK